MVICDYLDEITPGSLYPADAFAKAQNRSWIEFGNDILNTTFDLLRTDDPEKLNQFIKTLTDRFKILENEISDTDYFNGNEFLMIDAIFAPIFRYHHSISKSKDYGIFENTPKVKAWGDQLLKRPSVVNSVSKSYDEAFVNRFKKMNSIIGNVMAAG